MARTAREKFSWYDHRLALFLGLVAVVILFVSFLGSIFGPDEPTVTVSVDAEGRTTTEYVRPGATGPFRVTVHDSSGNLVEERFDRNVNGRFESLCHFADGILVETEISTLDDGRYDLRRTQSGDIVVDEYDRNHDGVVEERRTTVGGLRTVDELDFNQDGVVEQRTVYDADGRPLRVELDNDSDGTVDRTIPRAAPVPAVPSGAVVRPDRP